MGHKKIFWQIFPAYIFVVAASLTVVLFFSTNQVAKLSIQQKENDLEALALVISERVSLGDISEVGAYCDKVSKELDCRITIIQADGKVLGDTEKRPQQMDNHIDRDEIKGALAGINTSATRFSNTLRKKMLYVAVPVRDTRGEVIAAARVAVSTDSINQVIDGVADSIIQTGTLTALAAGIVSLVISRRISMPLVALRRGAVYFKTGNLEHRLAVEGSYETAALAATMNNMAAELDIKIKDINEQNMRQQAILSSMTEAVIAVDNQKIIILANHAAVNMFNMPADCIGRYLEQTARNTELNGIVDTMLTERKNILNKEISVFKDAQQLVLQTHATILETDYEQIGVLVVFNNVTQLKKLENIRKEFVANVSHELKTPITSIKGFVETLCEGAINDKANAMKFLDIIARQSARLESIIEDLLALSRIEQLEDGSQIERKKQPIKAVVSGAAALCRKKAEDKGIAIIAKCDEELCANINQNLLEQAVVNLIDNAVKYSDSGASVEVSAGCDGKNVFISVKDSGCGIPQSEFGRLFERFYRVDKARSRELGGTGLGLSIVKHIINAHKGAVTVESKVGAGSTFTIKLPC